MAEKDRTEHNGNVTELTQADLAERCLRDCVEEWPECYSGGYNPACCRFPKSCSPHGSIEAARAGNLTDADLEPPREAPEKSQDREPDEMLAPSLAHNLAATVPPEAWGEAHPDHAEWVRVAGRCFAGCTDHEQSE